jgi:hypothetical protein
MNNSVKFKWEEDVNYEAGIAIFEIGTITYSLLLPNFHVANLMHMVLSDVYQQGREDGIAKAAVRSMLSKISLS